MTAIARYKLRFFFDAGSGISLWSANEAACEKYDYPVETRDLPVPENCWRQASHVIAWYDTSLDWDDPAGPTPWDPAECERFNAAARALLDVLRRELGPEYEIVDEFRPVSQT